MIKSEVQEYLFQNRDTKYAEFQRMLIPNIDGEDIIGVRTPILRKLAAELGKRDDISEFLNSLPHKYYEENQLHSFLISSNRDFRTLIKSVNEFLPYIDNWAACDSLSPKLFRSHRDKLLKYIENWLGSEHEYTVRFGIKMLMDFYLDEAFSTDYSDMVSEIHSDKYYINMMIAWYFATALAKQYELILPYLEKKRLGIWVHNKTIQKAVESRRISEEQKNYLRTLRIKR